MKQKTLTLIFGMIFLVGLVAAAGTITNLGDSLTIQDFIAGGTTSTNFSFDYPDISEIYPNQEDYAPLMIKVNISSEDPTPEVWKKDFQLDGSMVNHGTWFSLDQKYNFNCYEDDFTYYYNQQPQEITNIPNGTFYCYNPGWLKMRIGSSNDVTLNINSDPALYPGTYNVTVGLYYPQEEYIKVNVTPMDDSNHIIVNTNSTAKFNMTFEISGGNAIRMKMSDLFEGYSSQGIWFVIGNGTNYTVEELNARLVYFDGTVNQTYSVGNDYNYSQPPIIFDTGDDGLARGSAIFMLDIKDYMEPGNYHGTYRFNVTKEN